VKRPAGYLSLLLALLAALGAWATDRLPTAVLAADAATVLSKALLVLAVVAAGFGLYRLLLEQVTRRTSDRRRQQDIRNVLRLAVVVATVLGAFAAVTEQWVGLLFSLGVVGFGATFALQQPLFSLVGWAYIVVKRPYQMGDRVAIEETTGDVVDVDLFVTTLWEVDGLVESHQPSGRTVTVPNSVVLSTGVRNFSQAEFPYVWNELPVQVAYETDLGFARERMAAIADDYLGDEMAARVGQYRDQLAETPVELEVDDRPTVNVHQRETWVELRLRYLVDPREAATVRNDLYERVLQAFEAEPERVAFPVGRTR
jgi:small-conductance mechanosensitive channel